METTLDKFGRVVIPKEVRDELDLKTGEILEIERHDEEIVLKPVHKRSPVVNKDGIFVFTGTATGDIADAINVHRGERLKKVSLWKRR